jgi:hypothetical protein
MKIYNFLKIYILFQIIFTEVYFIFPWMQIITLFNYLIIVVYFMKKDKTITKYESRILIVLLLFIIYLFVANILHHDYQKAFSMLITTLPIPFIFLIFSNCKKIDELIIFYINIYLSFNLLFSIMQLIGIYVTASSLWSNIPFLGTYRGFVGLSQQGLRISGAGSSTIGLAANLGIIFLFIYYFNINYFNTDKVFNFLITPCNYFN